jgi:hypothetical protein
MVAYIDSMAGRVLGVLLTLPLRVTVFRVLVRFFINPRCPLRPLRVRVFRVLKF